MGVKAALAGLGLFLPMLVPLLLMAPLADGYVSKCANLNLEELKCKSGANFCMKLKCTNGNVRTCGVVTDSVKNREDACKALDVGVCQDLKLGTLINTKEGCQLCGTDMCNNVEHSDGGDWNGAGGPFPVNWLLLIAASLLLMLGQNATR